jgi:large subunit ribosomal protein L10
MWPLALTKERKQEVVVQYEEWLKESQAVILTEYIGLSVSAIDELRHKLREVGGEFHIIKNTLGKRVFDSVGLDAPEEYFIGSTAIGIAFEDVPGMAKALVDFAKESEFVKIKGGFLGEQHMDAVQVRIMAELPPLPVVRAQLLGTLMAPASRLPRVLAEPGRQLAQVVKAYSEQAGSSAA